MLKDRGHKLTVTSDETSHIIRNTCMLENVRLLNATALLWQVIVIPRPEQGWEEKIKWCLWGTGLLATTTELPCSWKDGVFFLAGGSLPSPEAMLLIWPECWYHSHTFLLHRINSHWLAVTVSIPAYRTHRGECICKWNRCASNYGGSSAWESFIWHRIRVSSQLNIFHDRLPVWDKAARKHWRPSC